VAAAVPLGVSATVSPDRDAYRTRSARSGPAHRVAVCEHEERRPPLDMLGTPGGPRRARTECAGLIDEPKTLLGCQFARVPAGKGVRSTVDAGQGAGACDLPDDQKRGAVEVDARHISGFHAIEFSATDNGLGAGHGFALDGLDQSVFINGAMVGAPLSVTFKVDNPGRYNFYCSTQCSTTDLHPHMHGTLIVE
jgi:hypothetical protein